MAKHRDKLIQLLFERTNIPPSTFARSSLNDLETAVQATRNIVSSTQPKISPFYSVTLKYQPRYNMQTDTIEILQHNTWTEAPEPNHWHLHLLTHHGIKITRTTAADTLRYLASNNLHSPIKHTIQHILKTTPHQPNPHQTLRQLIHYITPDPSPIVITCFTKWLCGAVSRALNPGSRQDIIPMICGPQASGKSSLIHAISLGFHTDQITLPLDRTSLRTMSTAWICELGEISLVKRDQDTVKRDISTTHDRIDVKYQEKLSIRPRQSVFIGSTNERVMLGDSTGSRRFCPIDMTTTLTAEDISNIRRAAPTYIKSAHQLLQQNYDPILTSKEVQQLCTHSTAYYDDDPWNDTIMAWANKMLNTHPKAIITSAKALQMAFAISGSAATMAVRDDAVSPYAVGPMMLEATPMNKRRVDRIFAHNNWVHCNIANSKVNWRPKSMRAAYTA